MDSTAVVGFAQHAVDGFLPGLDPMAAKLLVGLIVSLIFMVGRLLARAIVPAEAGVSKWWTAHRDALNPLIVVILGLFGEGSAIGAILGFAGHGILKAGGKVVGHAATVSGIAKAKGRAVVVALMLSGLLLGAAGRSMAAEKPLQGLTVDYADDAKPVSFLERLSWGFGPGVRFDARPGANLSVGYVVGAVGYVWNDHLNLKARLWRDAEQAPKGGGAVEALWVW